MDSAVDIVHLGVPLPQARAVCIIVHGRGQSPDAMEESVVRHLSTLGVAYLLPRAPGGSWYAARAIDALNEDVRRELAMSLRHLAQVVDLARAKAPDAPLLLCGFSQGACLSLEYAFANGPWRGALVALTGCRVGQVADSRPSADLDALPTYLTAGDGDPWIPIAAFAETAVGLSSCKAPLRADVFPGRGHQVSPAEIVVLNGMPGDLAAGRPVSWSVNHHA